MKIQNEVLRHHRHNHSVFYIGKKKIALKNFLSVESAARERKAYDFLKDTSIKTPLIYHSDNPCLVTGYIESSQSNLRRAVYDWGRFHSETLGGKYDFETFTPLDDAVIGDIPYSNKIKKLFDRGPTKNISSLTHGDLYGENILTVEDVNYYIDFETFGVGHPARDLSLLLFNSPESYDSIVRDYRKSINFDYPGIVDDLNLFLLERLVRIINDALVENHNSIKFKDKYKVMALEQLPLLLSRMGD